ncbi:DNA polymerase III subunit delta [Bombiscardovia coagulans]|uniref:DNA-directed DNA polymerase n=1 Tax=Bombiscardovia coagulans TaxID=686666 RepID=A0A261ESW5_9BIFI|nr:DNA polymerase III subunit delta [Bombiscardovia coagulans]OZG49943.1 DNA polymerase III subunit delta [Bombiscardovia coagulans]
MTPVQAALAPVTIMAGGNAFLRDRAFHALKQSALESRPDADTVTLDADDCDAYSFEEAVSPSLLSPSAIVLVDHLENANEALQKSLLAFCKEATATPLESSIVICQYAGGNKNKQLVTNLCKAGAYQEKVADLKTADSKLSFVMSEFQRYGRQVEPQAAQVLVSVLGDRVDELAAMCEQVCFDFDEDPVPLTLVEQYLTDNPQSSGFRVADLAVDGKGSQAVLAMRQGIEQGVDVLAMVGAITYKIRLLAKIASLDAGKITMGQVGASPWQIRSARRQLRGWTSGGMSAVIESLAHADAEAKGVGGDPVYALERAILLIARKGR